MIKESPPSVFDLVKNTFDGLSDNVFVADIQYSRFAKAGRKEKIDEHKNKFQSRLKKAIEDLKTIGANGDLASNMSQLLDVSKIDWNSGDQFDEFYKKFIKIRDEICLILNAISMN